MPNTQLEEAIKNKKLPQELHNMLDRLVELGEDAPPFPGLKQAVNTDYFEKNYPRYKPVGRENIKEVVEEYLISKVNAKEETLLSATSKIQPLTSAATIYLSQLNEYQSTLSFKDALRMEYINISTTVFNKMYSLMDNQDIESYEEKLDLFLGLVDIYTTIMHLP